MTGSRDDLPDDFDRRGRFDGPDRPVGPGGSGGPARFGSPDGFGGPDRSGDPDGFGGFDGEAPDPLEPLLRPAPGFLAAPPGAFEHIRRRAARRRRLRTAAGATAAVAVVAGAVYGAGALAPRGHDQVVGPPASSVTAPASPAPTRPSPAPDAAPTGGLPATHRSTAGQGQSATPPARTPTTVPVPSDTAGLPGTGGTAGTAGTPMCATSQLTASLGGGDAGAGNLYRYLVLTNRSTTACHVNGYPGVSLLDSAGHQIGDPATRRPLDHFVVVLRPGAAASDTIHTVNQQGTCLPTSAQVRVYPPGNRASLVVAGRITVCDGMFEITPLLAGTTGNPAS